VRGELVMKGYWRDPEATAKTIRDGELAPGTDAGALAEFYTTVLAGMSMQSRDGATRKSLEATAAAAMRAWPEKPTRAKRRAA